MSAEIKVNKRGMGTLPKDVLETLGVTLGEQPDYNAVKTGRDSLLVPGKMKFVFFDTVFHCGLINRAEERHMAEEPLPVVQEQLDLFADRKVNRNRRTQLVGHENRALEIVRFPNGVLVGEYVGDMTREQLQESVPVTLLNEPSVRTRVEAIPGAYLNDEYLKWEAERIAKLTVAVNEGGRSPKLSRSGTLLERNVALYAKRRVVNKVFSSI